ncbi:hypothetical protein RFI_24710, partial [Reticulomyxa filosa]
FKYFKHVQLWQEPFHIIYSVKFSSYGTKIVPASKDKTIKIWYIASKKLIQVLRGHTNTINDAQFHLIKQWLYPDQATHSFGQEIKKLLGHSGNVTSVQFSSCGDLIVSSSSDKIVRIWNVQSGEQIKKIETFLGQVEHAQFSSDNQQIASVSSGSKITIYDIQSEQISYELKGYRTILNKIKFSPDGLSIISYSSRLQDK